jgi:hypothetical protein
VRYGPDLPDVLHEVSFVVEVSPLKLKKLKFSRDNESDWLVLLGPGSLPLLSVSSEPSRGIKGESSLMVMVCQPLLQDADSRYFKISYP